MKMEPNNQGDEALFEENIPAMLENVPLNERDALIVEMYEDGLSTYEIAIELELNRHTVSRVLKENRIETRTIADYHKFKHEDIEDLFNRGKSKHEIAKELGLTYYTVRKVLEDRGFIRNRKDKETLRIANYVQMKNRGYDNEAISIYLGLNDVKQLNKLIRNSTVNVTAVRLKTKKIESLPDIVRDRLEGKSIHDISMKYNLYILDVIDILYEFGLTIAKYKEIYVYHKQGKTIEEISEKLELSVFTVRRVMNKLKEIEKSVKLAFTHKQIAEKLNITTLAVKRTIETLQLI